MCCHPVKQDLWGLNLGLEVSRAFLGLLYWVPGILYQYACLPMHSALVYSNMWALWAY